VRHYEPTNEPNQAAIDVRGFESVMRDAPALERTKACLAA
jgi:hypothetical protein